MSLPQEQGVIPCLELCTALESCDQVSYDETGGRPVLLGGKSWVGGHQPPLLDWQAGDPLRQ